MLIPLMAIISKKSNMPMVMTALMTAYNLALQTNVNSKTTYVFTSDLVSFWITNMSMMVFYILVLMKQTSPKMYKITLMGMALVLMGAFNNWNFIMFYMLFEMSMIIILMVIIMWGYQPERMEAMMFMITMTLMFSLPFLMSMMNSMKTMNFWFTEINSQLLTFLSFMFIFMMKMPVYFAHFWLPKAHVEAPVQGSVILAAILLKLGCYGMIRMNTIIAKFTEIKPIVMSVSMISMMILSVNCIMQIDLKTLIAYSSIVHMTMVLMNIMIMKTKSMFSSMMIILGHGLCSGSLFFMANVMYVNSKSRSILLNKGILTTMPPMTLMWFLACMNNAPMPPSMNMLGELMSIKSILSWCPMMITPVLITALASSTYSIYLFCPPCHGTMSKLINKIKMTASTATVMMVMMSTPITLITVKPAMMMI